MQVPRVSRASRTSSRMAALHVLSAVLASLLLTAAASDLDEDEHWDAVSEFPGAERQGAILQALSFGTLNPALNISQPRSECVWRRPQDAHDACPDGDLAVHLYTSPNSSRLVNVSEANSLLQGDWDSQKHTIVLVHGYASAHDTLPMTILRDAYLDSGNYNLLVVDWSPLVRMPCYPAAVHNAPVAARCVGAVARLLRDSGARGDAWTCVGHSLGAHVCGIMADTVMFRVHKIIGLDPARPLIRPQNKHRLDAGDASVVHVMHTNAGHYGELGAIGTADFCINGGRTQPFCSAAKNTNLCSHLSSICFLADSIDGQRPLVAEPCGRRCPSARRAQTPHLQTMGLPASLGQHTPDSSSGTFCASTAEEPFCQREPGGRGHPRCCPPRHATETTTRASTTTTTTPATTTTTASTVATEAPAAAPPTTPSVYKVGAALPTTTTEPQPDPTTEPPQSPGFSPVTAPVRAEGLQPSAASTPAAPSTTSSPVRFPTANPAGTDAAPGDPQVPEGMLPPPMPLPDWKPVMFVESAESPESPVVDQEAPQRPRPSEPLLPARWKGPVPSGPESPARMPLTPERWTPPPVTVQSGTMDTPAAPAASAPVRWPSATPEPHHVTPGLHIVVPSNDTALYAEPAVTEGPVFAVYSTRTPFPAPPSPSPVVVVMADSGVQQQQPQQQHDIRDNLVEPSRNYFETTARPAAMDQEMAAMMEMSPPAPEPVLVAGFPSPSPPPPEPAAPEEPGMIPAAGSPTGAWLPMVMLPPMPFSVDAWALRYKDRLPRPTAVRRTSFRKKVYD